MSKQSLGAFARSLLPPTWRTSLRANRMVNWMLRRRYGGVRSVPHACSPHRLYFDGMRNLGWAVSGSMDVEAEEMDFIRNHLGTRRACAWDIGANVGSWMLFLAGLSEPFGRIICFEPDATNRRLLELNIARNQLRNVQLMPLAMSSESGTATFRSDPITGSTGSLETGASFIGEHYGQATVEITVEVRTVDGLVAEGAPPPDFMKIDVEGHEWKVLQGGRQTLAAHRPLLLMEVTANAQAIGDFLAELRYELISPVAGQKLLTPEFATVAVPRP
jgi:FkbM family methyltransferase